MVVILQMAFEHGPDPFAPPKEPVVCFCLHCGAEFESWQMLFKPRPRAFGTSEKGVEGDWCCPTTGCEGVGFGFDILPCDDGWLIDDVDKWWRDDFDEDFDFEGIVDPAVIDQFWREDPTALRPDHLPDDLSIDTECLDEHPLKRLLPPEELPANLGIREDDTPF